MSDDRVRGSQEPRFVLGLGHDNADVTVWSGSYRTVQQLGAKFRRTGVIGIQQNQDAPTCSRPARSKLDCTLQFA
jgi:hypothetical protein